MSTTIKTESCLCGISGCEKCCYHDGLDGRVCHECCEHSDVDGFQCLDCGEDLTEDMMCAAYDRAKDLRKYGE